MKNKYRFWRIIALTATTLIVLILGISTFSIKIEERMYYVYALIPLSLFLVFFIIHQMRFPLDLRLYIIWIFIMAYLAVGYGSTALSIMDVSCGIFLGFQIRFFSKRKILKFILFGFFYAAFACLQIRLGKQALFDSFMQLLGALCTVIIMYFIIRNLLDKVKRDILNEDSGEHIEEYFEQEGFTDRDKVMLREVLSGCKYEEIALNHKLSLSSVKKRLAYLYKKVGVTNQIDFIIKFTGKQANSTKV